MKKRIHPLKLVSVVVFCTVFCPIGLYVASFMYHFDVTSAPVRGPSGWLGPLPFGDSEAVDIGKVWYTDKPDVSSYRTYRPLCQLWLWMDGLSLGS